MIKNILLLIFLSVSTFATAQEKGFYYGTRFSLGESDLSGAQLANTTGKLFWQVGGASAFQFSDHIGVTADFLLSGKGTKNTGTHTSSGVLGNAERKYDEKINLISGDVPLCFKLSAELDKIYFKAYAGPSINFQFVALQTIQYENADYNKDNGFENKDISNNFETMSLGLVYGAGVDVKSGDGRLFFLDFRMSPFSTVGTRFGNDVKSSYLGLSAGYLFH